MVNVAAGISIGVSLPSRALPDSAGELARDVDQALLGRRRWMTGTTRPCGVSAAKPRW